MADLQIENFNSIAKLFYFLILLQVPYTWSSNTRGIVNGAFFVGYFFSQIPASLLFKRFGGRMIMAIFIGISTVCNLLQHPLALLFGRDLAHLTFIILRFFNGIGSGCFFGIYPSILSNWLPKNERSRTISIAFSGLYVGIPICIYQFFIRKTYIKCGENIY